MKEREFLEFFQRGLQSGCLVFPVPYILVRLGARKSTQGAIGEARGDLVTFDGELFWLQMLDGPKGQKIKCSEMRKIRCSQFVHVLFFYAGIYHIVATGL